jgi:hypothetical protein
MLKKWMFSLALMSMLALAACRPVELPQSPQPGSDAEPKPTQPGAPSKDISAPDPAGSEVPNLPDTDSSNGSPSNTPYAPQAGDSALLREPAYVEGELLQLESFPVQIVLRLTGSLPTPCHQLRVAAAQPDAQGKIAIDVYSVVDPNRVCAQVLQDVDVSVPLGTFPAGSYTVWVNDAQVGEFTQ